MMKKILIFLLMALGLSAGTLLHNGNDYLETDMPA